jgi:hypothetical protein
MKMSVLGAAAGIGLALAASAAAQTSKPAQTPANPPQIVRRPVELKIGDMAPLFVMRGSDDKIHRLQSLRGKTVVLAWFPKAFTGG